MVHGMVGGLVQGMVWMNGWGKDHLHLDMFHDIIFMDLDDFIFCYGFLSHEKISTCRFRSKLGLHLLIFS